MQIITHDNPEGFCKSLDDLIKALDKSTQINISDVDSLIELNRVVICKRMQYSYAQNRILQTTLFALSDKIKCLKNSKPSEEQSKIEQLAEKIQGCARVVLLRLVDLPVELQREIFSHLPFGILTPFISKALHDESLLSKYKFDNWVNDHRISLKALGCKTTKEAVDFLINNKEIVSANLSGFNDTTNADLIRLIKFRPDLKHLSILQYLKQNKIKNFQLEKLTQLESLVLEDVDINVLANVKNFKNLTHLALINYWDVEDLRGNRSGSLKFTDLPPIFENLTRFEIDRCKIKSEKDFGSMIKEMKNLKSLQISFCDLEGEYLAQVFESDAKITELTISSCGYFREEYITHILQCFPTLKYLNLTNLEQLSGAQLKDIFQCFANLHSLTISSCEGIEEWYLNEMIKNLIHIQILDLSFCEQLKGNLISESIKRMENLKQLSLSHCKRLWGRKPAESLKSLKNLEILDLEFCWHINKEKLVESLNALTKLVSVNIKGCSQLSTGFVDKLLNPNYLII